GRGPRSVRSGAVARKLTDRYLDEGIDRADSTARDIVKIHRLRGEDADVRSGRGRNRTAAIDRTSHGGRDMRRADSDAGRVEYHAAARRRIRMDGIGHGGAGRIDRVQESTAFEEGIAIQTRSADCDMDIGGIADQRLEDAIEKLIARRPRKEFKRRIGVRRTKHRIETDGAADENILAIAADR